MANNIPSPYTGGGSGGAPSGPAGGDLGSTYPNPTVTATHLSAALPVAQGGTGLTAAGAHGNVLFTNSSGTVGWGAAPVDWVNAVTAYGADPTGSADSTTPIQNALTAATAGSVVYLPAGTYKTTAPLSMPPGVVLHGPAGPNPGYWGDTAAVLKPSAAFAGTAVLAMPDVSHATTQGPSVRCLSIDGSSLVATADGIRSTGPVVEAFLFDVSISGVTGWAINTIQDASATGPQYPFEWHVRKVFAENCKTGGMNLTNMTDATWDDVYVLACGGGIAGTDSGTATGPGWSITWAANSQFTGCRAEWNGTYGFHLTGAWPTGTGAGGLSMVNCSTDRNNFDGFKIDATGVGPVILDGCQARRDGCNGSAGGGSYAGINVASANVPVIMSGITVFPGINDDGTGTNSPQFGLSVTSSNIVTVESGYIQAATTAVNSSGNTTFWVGPAVVTATGTTASPGSLASQQTNSHLKVQGALTTTNNTLDDGSGNITLTGGVTFSSSGQGFTFNGGGKTWIVAANPSSGFFVVFDQTDNQTAFSALGGQLFSLNNTLDDGNGNTDFNSVNARAGSASVAPLTLTSGTSLTTAAAGAVEFDGTAFYATAAASSRQVVAAEQIQILSGIRTFTNNTSAQAIFNATTNGTLTVQAATTYEFECQLIADSFSASSHTINFGLAGTATFTGISYIATMATTAGGNASVVLETSAAASAITNAGTGTVLNGTIRGTMRINAAGTIIPQLTQVTASAAAVVRANSFFRCWPIGSNTVTNVGDWT